MRKNWFDIILYTIKPFCGDFRGDSAEEFIDEIYELSEKIKDMQTPGFTYDEEIEEFVREKDERTVLFVDFLKKHGWLNRTIAGRMTEYMDSNVSNVFSKKVLSIYTRLKNISFNVAEHRDLYMTSISELLDTNGAAANPKYKSSGKEVRMVSDEYFDEFIRLFDLLNDLREDDRIMYNLFKMSVKMYLNGLSYKLMTGKEPETYNIIDVILPAMEYISNVERVQQDEKSGIYEILTDDYESDKEFITKLTGSDVSSLFKDFKADSVAKALDKIQSVYVKNNILISYLDTLLEDKDICADKLTDLKHATGQDDITPSVALECAVSPYDFGITQPVEMKELYDAVAEVCDRILKKLMNYVFSIEKNIVNTDAIMKDDFYLNDKLVISMPDCIDKWKSFIDSDMYRSDLFGKPMDDACREIAGKILGNRKKFGLLNKKECSYIIKVLKTIDLSKPMSEDIMFAFNRQFSDVLMSSSAWLQLLQFIKKFFQEPFNVKQDVKMSNVTGKNYYSAACVLIYLKDGSIKESYVDVVNALVFEGIAIFEEKSYVKYFNELAKSIKTYISKGKEGTRNVFTFIKDNIRNFGVPSKEEEVKVKLPDENGNLSQRTEKEVWDAVENVKTATDAANGK